MAPAEIPSETVRFGPFEVDVRSREIRKQGVRLRLPGQPFEILALLLEHPGEVVTRPELQKRLWPAETFVDFEHGMNNAMKKLRAALGDSADQPLYVETLARLGYRFIAPVQRAPDIDARRHIGAQGNLDNDKKMGTLELTAAGLSARPHATAAGRSFLWWLWFVAAIVAAILAGMTGFRAYHGLLSKPAFGDRGTVVVADFVNTTGDSVFDQALREGIEVDLNQSPFLDVLARPQIWTTLQMMGRSPDERVTDKVGLELCQRAHAQALLAGSIVGLGPHFVITLDALNCQSGDSLALEQTEAESKEAVLRALGQATRKLRAKLGESLGSLQQFGTPLEQATTTSLDALKAFTLGDEQRARGKYAEAIPFYQHAIDVDPEFVLAYARIGAVYYNVSEFTRAKDYFGKAFTMRSRVSERERLYLTARYYENVTGERHKAIDNYELWRRLYPRDWIPASNLGNVYADIAQYDNAVQAGRIAVQLNPSHAFPYVVLARAYKRANRFAEAKVVCEQAIQKRVDTWGTHSLLYQIAFAEGDEEGMRRQRDWGKGTSDENQMLSDWAFGEATFGHISKALELFGRSRDAAQERQLTESAAQAEAASALIEAVVGHADRARSHAASSLRLSKASGPTPDALLALALSGDIDRAEKEALDYEQRWPLDTIVTAKEIPTIRAVSEVQRGNPDRALERLRLATPYELRDFESLWVRGVTYLNAKRGVEAAGEFQKILDHQGVDPVSPFYALARLGLARARALAGDISGALSAYQGFFRAWKDADPDLPILVEARRESVALSAKSSLH
jgi:DNA-binding winged helix-turn-helix (wHTH) protein/tetratricopeptide (TPR) repeat protein